MYLFGIECDEPKGEFCCFNPYFVRDKNIFKNTIETMCRYCGATWERRSFAARKDEMWKRINKGDPYGKKITCKCGVATNVTGATSFECECGRVWSCLIGPSGVPIKDGKWIIGLDISGKVSEETRNKLKKFYGGMEPEEIKTKQIETRIGFNGVASSMKQFENTMRQMGKAMGGLSKPTIPNSRDIDKEVSKNIYREKNPDKYAPRPLSSDEKPKKNRRWFLPALLAIMTLLSGVAASFTIADKWPDGTPTHRLLDSVKPYVNSLKCNREYSDGRVWEECTQGDGSTKETLVIELTDMRERK